MVSVEFNFFPFCIATSIVSRYETVPLPRIYTQRDSYAYLETADAKEREKITARKTTPFPAGVYRRELFIENILRGTWL